MTRQNFAEETHALALSHARPLVLHAFGGTFQTGTAWHEYTACGIDAGAYAPWLPLDILNPEKVRPCRRCFEVSP